MRNMMKRQLAVALSSAVLSFTPFALANGGDSSSDVPGGFADVMEKTKGVMVRVPINASGQEDTNRAELRFYQRNDTVTKASDPKALWERAINPGNSPEVRGTNAPADSDSSTWGWYNWYNVGWAYPYYYSYYYPTFYSYYYNYYWYYSYYSYWNYYDYRYYYYYYWW